MFTLLQLSHFFPFCLSQAGWKGAEWVILNRKLPIFQRERFMPIPPDPCPEGPPPLPHLTCPAPPSALTCCPRHRAFLCPDQATHHSLSPAACLPHCELCGTLCGLARGACKCSGTVCGTDGWGEGAWRLGAGGEVKRWGCS